MAVFGIQQFRTTAMQIPRFNDQEVIRKIETFLERTQTTVSTSRYQTVMSDQSGEVNGSLRSPEIEKILTVGSVVFSIITAELNNNIVITVSRTMDPSHKIIGNLDTVSVRPVNSNSTSLETFVTSLALVREIFGPVDTQPFQDFLAEDVRSVYQSRDNDLQRLEKMQEHFVESLTTFTLEQQKKQESFRLELAEANLKQQLELEALHQAKVLELEEKKQEYQKLKDEIDERDNRTARRDIYKELTTKLAEWNDKFELTDGTQKRRNVPFVFTLVLIVIFGLVFLSCLLANVFYHTGSIHWVTVVSQIGSALAFLGLSTFFIRWNNIWLQKHVDEEFRMKRLGMDIHRANLLAELCFEWEKIAEGEIPKELIEKLSRNLFVPDNLVDIDMHPIETVLGSFFGKTGSVSVEPGKFSMQRSDSKP